MTQRVLAEELGVTVQHLSNIERGKVRIAKVYALAIAYILRSYLMRTI